MDNVIQKTERSDGADFYIVNGVLKQYSGRDETVTVPEGVSVIGKSAFKENKTIRSVILPGTVEQIDDFAFYYCEKLESVSLPEGLTQIGSSTFFCSGITSLVFRTV